MGYDINFLGAYDAESLIEELKRIAATTGKPTVTVTDIDAMGRVSFATVLIARRFGTWNKALLAANELADRRWTRKPARAPGERGSISVTTRYGILKRDLYRCCICNTAGVELEVDHIIPVARGGSDEPDNLQTLCVPCNRGKSDSLQ